MRVVEIPLTKGYVALVNTEDLPLLPKGKWTADVRKNGKVYARKNVRDAANKPQKLYMHHCILPPKQGVEVDHRNNNGIDNRRNNLRYLTQSQNQANRHRVRAASGYKGVVRSYKKKNPWRVQIQGFAFGNFKTKEEAARAYDLEALKRFGDCAKTNFPLEEYAEQQLLEAA